MNQHTNNVDQQQIIINLHRINITRQEKTINHPKSEKNQHESTWINTKLTHIYTTYKHKSSQIKAKST